MIQELCMACSTTHCQLLMSMPCRQILDHDPAETGGYEPMAWHTSLVEKFWFCLLHLMQVNTFGVHAHK